MRELDRKAGGEQSLHERRDAAGVVVPSASVHIGAEGEVEDLGVGDLVVVEERVVAVVGSVGARHFLLARVSLQEAKGARERGAISRADGRLMGARKHVQWRAPTSAWCLDKEALVGVGNQEQAALA